MEVWIWLGVIVLSIILELATFQLISIWFACGGLISLILCAVNVPFTYQIIVFIVISGVLLISLRKWSIKLLNKTPGKTNMELLIGTLQVLLTDIKKGTGGTVKINGVVWNVMPEKNINLKAGSYVVIKEIKGNTLIVEKGEN